jgi:hypothetical protein
LKTIIFLSFFLSFNSLANSWEDETFSENKEYQFWTGISSPQKNLSEAINEAYNLAINEAVKYNFGFNQKITESFYQNIDKKDIYKENHVETPTIRFNKVLPVKQKILKTKNGHYIVKKQLRYSKKEIELEKKRLQKNPVKVSNKSLYNLVIESNQGNKIGTLKINSSPINAKIKLTPLKKIQGNKEFYLSANNTEFIIPLGSYMLEVIKDGYKVHQRKILLSGKEQSMSVLLEPADSWLDLRIHPSNTSIYVNNERLVSKSKIKVVANKIYDIKLTHPDYLSETFQTSVISSDYKIVEKYLKPKKSAFQILSEPSNATVFANGNKIGNTPILNFNSEDTNIDFIIIKKGFALQRKFLKNIKPNSINDKITFILEDE